MRPPSLGEYATTVTSYTGWWSVCFSALRPTREQEQDDNGQEHISREHTHPEDASGTAGSCDCRGAALGHLIRSRPCHNHLPRQLHGGLQRPGLPWRCVRWL